MNFKHVKVKYSILLLLSLLFSANAGLYMQHKRHTDPYSVMGTDVPARDETVTTKVSGNRARLDQGADTSVILNLDDNRLVFLDHKGKTYAETDFNEIKNGVEQAMQESGMDAEQMRQMASMMQGMMQVKASVTKTAENKKIKNWSCTKYLVDFSMATGTTKSEMWTTTAIKISPEFYQKIRNSMMLNMPGMQESLKEFEKIQGVSVLSTSESNVMGSTVKQTEELMEMKEMNIPAETFSVPQGYKKKSE